MPAQKKVRLQSPKGRVIETTDRSEVNNLLARGYTRVKDEPKPAPKAEPKASAKPASK